LHLNNGLAPAPLVPEGLRVCGEIVSAQRVEGGGSASNLTAEDRLRRWQSFRQRHLGKERALSSTPWEFFPNRTRFDDETAEKKKAAGGVLTAKQAPTGPAPPRRTVCALGTMSLHCIADQL
jgi:hypothetical protein